MIRRLTLRRRDRLSGRERMDLTFGPWTAFSSDAERRAAWFRHRDTLMAGTRIGPAAYWDYEGPPELRREALTAIAAECEPSREMLETWGYKRAVQITAHSELTRRRRAWLKSGGSR